MAERSSTPTSQSRRRKSPFSAQPPAPALEQPPAALPMTDTLVADPRVSNQLVINAFARAATVLGAADPWALLARSGLNLSDLATQRDALYTGPRFDQLATLSHAERAALMAALGQLTDTRRPAAPATTGGSLRLNPDVMSVALTPATNRMIPTPLPADASTQAQMMARIWNRYGGLLDRVGSILQVDPTLAAGVLAIESGGRAFSANGRMIIRFEIHVFLNLWGQSNADTFNRFFRVNSEAPWRGDGHQWRPDEQSEWRAVHAGQDGEWDAFGFARVYCSDEHAKLSISMGAPQIMGFNHARIGYADVASMYDAFENDERSQIVGFFDFVRTDVRLLEAMRKQDLLTFATYYNGTAVADTYARLMSDATAALRPLLPAATENPDPDACLPSPGTPPTSGPWGVPAPSVKPVTLVPLPSQPDHLPLPTLPTAPTTPTAPTAPTAPATGDGAGIDGASGGDLSKVDPVLYAYWQEHVRLGFEQNSEMFRRVLDGFMNPYYTTVWMYRILFSVGLLAFVAGVGLSVWSREPVYALIFGGLSAAAFISYFFNRPLQALEENLQFITWLGIIYNTYWTRLAYMFDQKTVQQDLHAATSDAVEQLDRLLNKHAELSGKRPKAE